MPGKIQDLFRCSLLLRIVSAGWCG
ncbi:RepA leader peptide Tap [Escherichia coli]|nr:RepA leader peptide Tap [Escherichia coli]HDQ6731635.1 RepA leader peptide Tap [Escherichia coli O11:H5]EEQ2667184.1 RepA leader peptide Tap [Escherichia coli]EEQ3052217.1 RepA leader peptide Tap [Escherichia coli]EEQ7829537.1 RepA leader peptide Tap [Escherichia coli]EER8341124.1 RepA leader peptide Tap [Escherichia coli]